MSTSQPNDRMLEQAALYALGSLEGEERETFERLVTEGCATCQAVEEFQNIANRIGVSVQPVTPPPHLRQKLLDRLQREKPQAETPSSSSRPPDPGLTFVHSGQGEWQAFGEGMWLKVLYADEASGRVTALVRMAPGTNYAPHRHKAAEEFYVLEGTCQCGGRLLLAGDYHRAETGSIHHETSTADGCLMIVIASPNNEMLDPVNG